MPADLVVQVEIMTPLGPLLLEDQTNGYSLAKACFANHTVGFRKQEISSIYVGGTFPVRAAPDNITEALVVDITGSTQAQLYDRKKALIDGLTQLSYQMTVTFGNHQEVWTCFVTGYTEQEDQEWRVAVSAQIQAQVPRLPYVVSSVV